MAKVRCNNCMRVFDEKELIYDEDECMEFCPYCGKGWLYYGLRRR